MQWLLWKLYHNWVASRKTRMRWFHKEANSYGETDAKSLGIDSKRAVHSVYATSSKYTGKERTIEWKNTSQISSSAKSLRYDILRAGPMKRLKDNSDVPEAWLGTLPKAYTSSKRKTKIHSTRPQKNGYSRLRQQKSCRKESLWWIPQLVCIWSASETLTLLTWRPWGHRGVRRRWWRPTARCKPEKKPRYMSKNWTLLVKVMLLEETPAVLSLGKICEDHGYSYHWTSSQKPHLTKKGKRIDCKTMCHL